MDSKRALFLVLGVVGVISLSYIAYFDYKRRNDPVFRRRLSEFNVLRNITSSTFNLYSVHFLSKEREKKRAAEIKKAKEEDNRNKLTTSAQEALDEVCKEVFPEAIDEKEKYFLDHVAKGETFFAAGENGYQAAAICFYKALKVYPSPLELIVIYQKTIPEAVFSLVYTMMSLEVKKKQEEYWKVFPTKDMNVKIQKVENNSSEKDKLIPRGVFAKRDFSPGEIIYEEKPIVSALDPILEGGHFCSYCLKEMREARFEDQDLFSSVYCTEKCQETARAEYSNLLFQRPPGFKMGDNPETRLVNLVKDGNLKIPLMIAKFMARMVYEETEKVSKGIEEDYSIFDHIERLRYLDLAATPKEHREIEILKELLASKVPGIEEFISEERYMMFKGKLLYNAYGVNTAREYTREIIEDSKETVRSNASPITGAGFYHVTSYIAHSCDPNVDIEFTSGDHILSVVATKRIMAGEEIKVSYIVLGERETYDRKEELSKKWKFSCSCSKCRGGEYVDDPTLLDEDDEKNWVDDDNSESSLQI
ncbi:hypothetical protein G9A89_013610 [Geosiphon pyriformis]|nr:hypothetical protein G9A89_013610 [Geosiphon pyriformis]